ncbi:MAG: hypothetical protein HGB11_05650 [Chlorobiales bacterium]|nr:hypothetical protein [Chlorobiales bacterium]
MGCEYEPSGELHFLSKKLGTLKKAIGNKVWVIQGIPEGKRTAFTLCAAYVAESISPESPSSDVYVISGKQVTEFDPPLPLNKLDWFTTLLKSQSNFSLGFNRLTDKTVIQALIAIESGSDRSSSSVILPDLDFSVSGTEGATRFVTHLRRERDHNIVEAKKVAILNTKGNLSCEVCGFDFFATYGKLGYGLCEVHHLKPLSASNESVTTMLDDLAVLCSNCHRIIHRSDPMLTIAELSKLLHHDH